VTGNGLPFSAGVEVDRHALDKLDGPAIGMCDAPKHLPPLQHTESMTVVCIGVDECTLYCCNQLFVINLENPRGNRK
jgi:hypothetical protein